MQGKTSRVNDSRKKEEEVVAMGLHKQVPRRVHVRRERRKAIFGINAPVSRSLGRHSFRRCLRFPRLPQVLILGRHFFCFSSLVTHTQTHATKRCVRLQQLPPSCLVPHLGFTAPPDRNRSALDDCARAQPKPTRCVTGLRRRSRDLEIAASPSASERLVRLLCGAIVAGFELGKCGRGVECQISLCGWRRLEWNGVACGWLS